MNNTTDENNTTTMQNLSEEDARNLEQVLDDVVNSMVRQDAERTYVNEALKQLQDNYGINKKILRQVAKARKDDSYKEKEQEMEELETVYQTVYGEE